MEVDGQRLHIVTPDDVAAQMKKWGVRVAVEASPLVGRSAWAARIVLSHVLLPGMRHELGLLVQPTDETHVDLLMAQAPEQIWAQACEALSMLPQAPAFSISSRPASFESGPLELSFEAAKHLH